MHTEIRSVEAVKEFALAGNSTFTLRSKATEKRFTYRVRASDDGKVHFVKVMTGPDNESSYGYLGVIRDGVFQHGRKSKIGENSPSSVAFDWFWGNLANGVLSPKVEFWHEGKCGRCNRKLTVPESIERGLGPECASIMGTPLPQLSF